MTPPLLFRQMVALDVQRHGKLRLDRRGGYGYAAVTNAVPLGLPEFTLAAADYPIVFACQGAPEAIALLGFRNGENLFVDAAGAWLAGTYVPAYVRGYPFALVAGAETGQTVLAIDPKAPCLSRSSGQPLFEGRKPSAALDDALRFCAVLRDAFRQMHELGVALEAAGLLTSEEAVLDFTGGGTARLAGFRVVDRSKFQALGDRQFLEWRSRGWLAPIYAHFNSLASWPRLIERAAARRPRPHPAPRKSRDGARSPAPGRHR
jgi:hypothetical protein